MGMLNVSSQGSFRPAISFTTKAIDHGHAHAVKLAIKKLAEEALPAAIRQDAQLRKEGAAPNQGFLPEDIAVMDALEVPGVDPQSI